MIDATGAAPDPRVLSDEPLWRILLQSSGFYFLALADELELFDHVGARGQVSIDELAAHYGARRILVETLAGYLEASGMLEGADGGYRLTALARKYLLRDSADYWGGTFAGWRRYDFYRQVKAIFVSGATEHLHTARWAGGGDDPRTPAFLASMQGMNRHAAQVLAADGRYAGVRRMLDVAGGSGCFAIEACRVNPTLRCTVLELPDVVPHTGRYIAATDLADRVDTVACDMFASDWPTGHDAVFLSNVLHDWDREACVRILRRARAALAPGGNVLLHEMVVPERDGSEMAAQFSLIMFYRSEGRQWRLTELAAMLAEAGFEAPAVFPGAHAFRLVRARRGAD